MEGNASSPAAMTITIDELVRRNANFAAGGAFAGLPFPTNQTLRVIGCVDSRVDPSHVLDLELGEAVVMRNIGGRVTPRCPSLVGVAGKARTGPSERPTRRRPAAHGDPPS